MPVYARRGKLFFDFSYLGSRCREYTKLNDTPANKKRVESIMDRIEAEKLLGTFEYAKYFPNSKRLGKFQAIERKKVNSIHGVPFFEDFTKLWFKENEIAWKYSYKSTLRNSLSKHILPVFGEIPVSIISKAQILDFRTKLASFERPGGVVGLSPSRINHVMTPLRMILAEAADRYEFDTPFKNIKPLRVPKTQVDPFSFEEVKLILDHVRKDYRNYFIIRFFTGMRTGEVHGLKWKYIDFERKQILIRESFVADRMTTTKNDSSVR